MTRYDASIICESRIVFFVLWRLRVMDKVMISEAKEVQVKKEKTAQLQELSNDPQLVKNILRTE